jgi:hypothetical protein
VIAEDQPIDIWNIDKKAIETTSKDISSNEITVMITLKVLEIEISKCIFLEN